MFRSRHRFNKKEGKIEQQGQEILLPEEGERPSSGGLLRWLIVIIVLGLLLGAGVWYYSHFIIKPAVQPTPSSEVTEAIWKTKSEKTVNDFLTYWLKTKTDAQEQAKKARDLLTVAAQAKLETLKDSSGKSYSELKDKLMAFLELSEFPKEYQIFTTKKIDEKTVEVTIKLNYNQESALRVFTVILEGSGWLIDGVSKESILKSPSPALSPAGVSPSPIASPSSLPTTTPSETF